MTSLSLSIKSTVVECPKKVEPRFHYHQETGCINYFFNFASRSCLIKYKIQV